MSTMFHNFVAKALELPKDKRAELVHELISSLDEEKNQMFIMPGIWRLKDEFQKLKLVKHRDGLLNKFLPKFVQSINEASYNSF